MIRCWREEGFRGLPLYTEAQSVFFRVRAAYTAGNFSLVLDLLNAFPVECWYGGDPAELMSILQGLPHGSEQHSILVRYARDFYAGQAEVRVTPGQTYVDSLPQHAAASSGWDAVMQSQLLRMQGFVHEAFALLPTSDPASVSVLRTVSATVTTALLKLLRGTALMLLCKFDDARKELLAAQGAQLPAELIFLRREAILKTALIEAFYGDTRAARGHIRFASEIPRTSSWMEAQLDAVESLVRALSSERNERVQRLRAVSELPLQRFGVMWPFAVLGLPGCMTKLGANLSLWQDSIY